MTGPAMAAKATFSGPPGLTLRQVLGTRTHEEIRSWFAPGNVCFVHRARTAIRHLRTLTGCAAGDEILVPSYNCGTEIDALLAGGFKVVLYGIDRAGRIDPGELEARLSERTRGVYVIHYFGFPQPLAEIKEWCDRRGLFLVEDCALGLFSAEGSRPLGSTGDAAVFSLTKSLPVPDGGVLLLNNPGFHSTSWPLESPEWTPVLAGLLPLVKSMVLRGSSGFPAGFRILRALLQKWRVSGTEAAEEGSDPLPDMPPHYYFDGKMADRKVSTMTLSLLRGIDPSRVRARRRGNYLSYREILRETGIRPLFDDLPEGVCPLYYPILVDDPIRMSRALNEKAIASVAWWCGFHRGLPWEEHPEARYLKEHVLALPVHQDLGPEHVEHICREIRELLGKNGKR
jgi:dTDP-4-amino-4,6-dideoxygalactose transaminase